MATEKNRLDFCSRVIILRVRFAFNPLLEFPMLPVCFCVRYQSYVEAMLMLELPAHSFPFWLRLYFSDLVPCE